MTVYFNVTHIPSLASVEYRGVKTIRLSRTSEGLTYWDMTFLDGATKSLARVFYELMRVEA